MMDEQRENPDTDNTPTESVSPDWHDAKDIGDSMVGKEVGRYTIRRVIGSGGMGTVYEAIQQSPRRTVALKMMKQGLLSRSARRRIQRVFRWSDAAAALVDVFEETVRVAHRRSRAA